MCVSAHGSSSCWGGCDEWVISRFYSVRTDDLVGGARHLSMVGTCL